MVAERDEAHMFIILAYFLVRQLVLVRISKYSTYLEKKIQEKFSILKDRIFLNAGYYNVTKK